jgi:hypothetical protein
LLGKILKYDTYYSLPRINCASSLYSFIIVVDSTLFSSISLSLLLNPYTIGMLRLLSLSKMKNLSHQKISPLIAITGK